MTEIHEFERQVKRLDEREAEGGIAHGLPRLAYKSEAFYALEQERVFARGWVFAGLASGLSVPWLSDC